MGTQEKNGGFKLPENRCFSETTVRLIDGREASSHSEEWRHECEARAILNMDAQALRRKHLQRIGERRGQAERRRLEDTILTIYRAMTVAKCV